MTTPTAGCCGDIDCWTLPPEFVRVKYFYGQRLGVMELSDEARYHAGKHAFHNVREHGYGVLCGLGVDLFAQTAGAATTVLRVRRGAAVDGCGREMIVGCDQCVDVGAWYSANKGRPELSGWTPGATPSLYVAIRYRECPTDPCAAPRDPCGCDNGGAEFGRVREGFELALLTDTETSRLDTSGSRAQAALARLLAGSASSSGDPASSLRAALDTFVAHDCPSPDDQQWLALAVLTVTLDPTTGVPTNLGKPDITLPQRVSLLSTSAMQSLLLQLVAAGAGTGALAGGPSAGALGFTASGAGSPGGGTLTVAVTLANGGTPAAPQAIVANTLQPSMVTLEQLDASAATGWDAIALGSVTVSTSPSQISIAVPGNLSGAASPATGPVYRLTIAAPAATPIVDALGRPLTPAPYVRTFSFSLNSSNTLTLAATV